MALEHLLKAFGRHGYALEADWRPSRVAVIADGARQVDVLPIVFDAPGTGWQANVEGQEGCRRLCVSTATEARGKPFSDGLSGRPT
jgi:hypothetical protein